MPNTNCDLKEKGFDVFLCFVELLPSFYLRACWLGTVWAMLGAVYCSYVNGLDVISFGRLLAGKRNHISYFVARF